MTASGSCSFVRYGSGTTDEAGWSVEISATVLTRRARLLPQRAGRRLPERRRLGQALGSGVCRQRVEPGGRIAPAGPEHLRVALRAERERGAVGLLEVVRAVHA